MLFVGTSLHRKSLACSISLYKSCARAAFPTSLPLSFRTLTAVVDRSEAKRKSGQLRAHGKSLPEAAVRKKTKSKQRREENVNKLVPSTQIIPTSPKPASGIPDSRAMSRRSLDLQDPILLILEPLRATGGMRISELQCQLRELVTHMLAEINVDEALRIIEDGRLLSFLAERQHLFVFEQQVSTSARNVIWHDFQKITPDTFVTSRLISKGPSLSNSNDDEELLRRQTQRDAVLSQGRRKDFSFMSPIPADVPWADDYPYAVTLSMGRRIFERQKVDGIWYFVFDESKYTGRKTKGLQAGECFKILEDIQQLFQTRQRESSTHFSNAPPEKIQISCRPDKIDVSNTNCCLPKRIINILLGIMGGFPELFFTSTGHAFPFYYDLLGSSSVYSFSSILPAALVKPLQPEKSINKEWDSSKVLPEENNQELKLKSPQRQISVAEPRGRAEHFDAVYKHLLPTQNDLARLKSFLRTIEHCIKEKVDGASIKIFGSAGSDLWMGAASDVDLTMLNGEGKSVRILGKIIRAAGYSKVEVVANASIPIVKFNDHLRHIESDINIGNILGVRNTELIRAYVNFDPRVKQFLFLVKHFVKCKNIADGMAGTPSSYAHVIMALNYLQTRDSPIVPSLQASAARANESHYITMDLPEYRMGIKRQLRNPELVVQKAVDCAFHPTDSTFRAASEDNATVVDLLRGYFEHYAHVFDWEKDVACIRTGRILPKSASPFRDELAVVVDPFVRWKNLCRPLTEKNLNTIKDEFAKAALLLKKQPGDSVVKGLFSVIEKPEKRKKRSKINTLNAPRKNLRLDPAQAHAARAEVLQKRSTRKAGRNNSNPQNFQRVSSGPRLVQATPRLVRSPPGSA